LKTVYLHEKSNLETLVQRAAVKMLDFASPRSLSFPFDEQHTLPNGFRTGFESANYAILHILLLRFVFLSMSDGLTVPFALAAGLASLNNSQIVVTACMAGK
jgi:hypothetical protein